MALLPGSPAIDAGVPISGLDRDQRYAVRPIGAGFDIGAVEFGTDRPSLVVDVATDTFNPVDGHTSLREAVAFANLKPGADAIAFAPEVFGSQQTIMLNPAFGQLTLSEDATITGPAGRVTLARSTAAGTPA